MAYQIRSERGCFYFQIALDVDNLTHRWLKKGSFTQSTHIIHAQLAKERFFHTKEH